MSVASRRFRREPCPICARWTCRQCGRINHRADSRQPQTCSRCGSVEGTLAPVTHYDPNLHEAHTDLDRMEGSVQPVDMDRMIHNSTLVELLYPLVIQYESYRRRSRSVAHGTPDWNRSVNLANRELIKIEATVRSWTAQHPEGP